MDDVKWGLTVGVQSMFFSFVRLARGLLLHYFETVLESHSAVCGVLSVVVRECSRGAGDQRVGRLPVFRTFIASPQRGF